MDRRVGFARDGSDGFDKGLNRRGWVVVFDHGLLCRAWSARSGFCVLVGMGHGVGFFFFLFNMSFCSSGILVGSGQWWHGGHGGGAVVVTG